MTTPLIIKSLGHQIQVSIKQFLGKKPQACWPQQQSFGQTEDNILTSVVFQLQMLEGEPTPLTTSPGNQTERLHAWHQDVMQWSNPPTLLSPHQSVELMTPTPLAAMTNELSPVKPIP